MHDLAEAVGVSKATLYYHIGRKEGVLYEIHERFMQEGLRLLTEDEAKQASPTERLVDFYIGQCWMTRRHQDEIAVVMADLDRLSERSRRAMIKKRDEYFEFLERIIGDGIASGEFRDLDPRLTALCAMGMVNWLHRWYRTSGPLPPDKLGRFMAAIVIGGISQRPSQAQAIWENARVMATDMAPSREPA